MNRVVVTGMGVISPIGNTVRDFYKSLKGGIVGIDEITRFDRSDSKIKLAAEVKEYDAEQYMTKKDTKRMDLFSQYAVSASCEAFEMSGLNIQELDARRFGVMVGSGIGGLSTMETEIIKMSQRGEGKVAPLYIPMAICNMAAGNVAIKLGAKGVCTSVVTACAAATHSIGEAFRNIKHGYSDVIMAGGSEAGITPSGIAGFNALKALSQATDRLRASIPFDQERGGFVLGEGAGVLVLEEYEHAKKRGADIYAEIVGYGASCDAHHITAPLPDGEGAANAMRDAIHEAGITPEQIDYINAHGTGTQLNDKAETNAVKMVFGEHAYKLHVSSTKSMTGHLLGAAGGIEAVACILACNHQFIPATVGLKEQDEECDLNYVPNEWISKRLRYVLSNSLGFGGHNAVLCIKEWEETL